MERLSSEQEALLRSVLDKYGPGAPVHDMNCSHNIRELADQRYLNLREFIIGDCEYMATGKAVAYFEQLGREEAEKKAAKRHDWALNLVNGVYLIAGVVLGVIAGVAVTLLAGG